ncbi:hypothetical protein LguiB_021110 [Lonicera macranthoides]
MKLYLVAKNNLSPYDTSASLNPNNCISSSSSNNGSSSHGNNIRFPGIATAIEESIVWDGVYFVRIEECGGYEYEQSYALLPLLPISISFLSTTVFAPLIPLIGHRAVLGLSGYVLDNIAFLFAAVYLYRHLIHSCSGGSPFLLRTRDKPRLFVDYPVGMHRDTGIPLLILSLRCTKDHQYHPMGVGTLVRSLGLSCQTKYLRGFHGARTRLLARGIKLVELWV